VVIKDAAGEDRGQSRGGFVENEELRRADQAAADAEEFPFAAAEEFAAAFE
jgi:hypothetical protein